MTHIDAMEMEGDYGIPPSPLVSSGDTSPTSTGDSILASHIDVQAVSHTMASSDDPMTYANIVI